MRTGRRIAFDIGKSRIGISVSDFHGILASPRDFATRDASDSQTVKQLAEISKSEEAIEVYVGLPTNLKGNETESTLDAVSLALLLQAELDIEVRLIDERFSTKIASSAMSDAGKNTRAQRGSIDSAAATVILETALDSERESGLAPGELVTEFR